MNQFSDLDRNLSAENNDIKLDYDVAAIENSIENILTVEKGEVPGRPNFGSVLSRFLFEMMDEITFAAMEQSVYEALDEFEPRIRVEDVQFEAFYDQHIVLMKLYYSVLGSGARQLYQKTFEV